MFAINHAKLTLNTEKQQRRPEFKGLNSLFVTGPLLEFSRTLDIQVPIIQITLIVIPMFQT